VTISESAAETIVTHAVSERRPGRPRSAPARTAHYPADASGRSRKMHCMTSSSPIAARCPGTVGHRRTAQQFSDSSISTLSIVMIDLLAISEFR